MTRSTDQNDDLSGEGFTMQFKQPDETGVCNMADHFNTLAQDSIQTRCSNTEVILLSRIDQLRLSAALLAPPSPSPALERAMRRHDELFG